MLEHPSGIFIGYGVNLHLACKIPFQNKTPIILKQMINNVNKNITFNKSSAESTKAIMIFRSPGNFDIDLRGRSTLKLRSADKLGKIGTKDTMLLMKRDIDI